MTDKPTKEFEKIYDEISTKSDFHERFLTEEMYSIEYWLGWLFYLKGLEESKSEIERLKEEIERGKKRDTARRTRPFLSEYDRSTPF